MDKKTDTFNLKIKVEKVVGQADGEFSCGVFSKRVPVNDDEMGTLVGCFLIKGVEVEKSGQVLHELFELLVKKFEGPTEGVLSRLNVSRDMAGDHINELGLEGSFVASFFYKNVCYIVRHGNLVKIFVYKVPDSSEIKFESGSGHIFEGQLFVLGTEKFFGTFDAGIFAREEHIDFDEMVDGLATDISAEVDQGQIGAAFVQVGEVDADKDRQVEETNTVEDASTGKEDEVEDKSVLETLDHGEVEEGVIGVIVEGKGSGGLLKALLLKLRGINIKAFFVRRNIAVLALVLILILVGSGFWTIKSKADSKKQGEFTAHMVAANSKFSEGSSLLGLNSEKGRNILIDAQNEVKAALSINPNDSSARTLSDEITQKLKGSEAQASVSFSTFYDSGTNVVGVGSDSGNFVVFGDNSVVEVDKSGKKVADFGGVSDVLGGAVYSKGAFVLTGKGVIRLDSDKSQHDVEKGDSGQDIGVFLGNVYVLSKNQINKYVPVEGGYSKSAPYLENTENFGGDCRLAIDGSIWVTNGANIFKYTRGKKEDFSLSGLVGGGGNYGEIYTNADIDNLYVIDRTNSALLVFGKDGVYKKAYQAKEFAQARDLLVDETLGKMYIASGSKILTADLGK